MRSLMTYPPAEGPYPAVTAIVFMAAVAASLWWDTRKDAPNPPVIVPSTQAAPALAPAPPSSSEAVTAFIAFADQAPPPELPLDHGYTAEGIRRLAAAVATEGNTMLWRDRAKRLRAAADELGNNPNSLRHADIARGAFTLAADWLVDLRSRQASGPHSDVLSQNLKAAAGAIHREKPLRTQKDAVDGFFDAAAAAMAPAENGPLT